MVGRHIIGLFWEGSAEYLDLSSNENGVGSAVVELYEGDFLERFYVLLSIFHTKNCESYLHQGVYSCAIQLLSNLVITIIIIQLQEFLTARYG